MQLMKLENQNLEYNIFNHSFVRAPGQLKNDKSVNFSWCL